MHNEPSRVDEVSIDIGLTVGGNTTGRLFAPGGGDGGGDLDADLAGTWNLTADTVRFSHAADTFIRDISFTVGEGELLSDDGVAGVTFDIVLARR